MKEKVRQEERMVAVIINEKGKKKIIDDSYNVLAVLKDKFGRVKQFVYGKNIVTNDGDIFFAQKGAGEVPTNAFINLVLGSGTVATAKADNYDSVTPIASTNKAPSAGYPKTDDAETDNTGKAIDSVTWKYAYVGADFNHAAITEGCITIAAPAAGSKVLTRFLFAAAFEKAATDTLTIYCNENMLGV